MLELRRLRAADGRPADRAVRAHRQARFEFRNFSLGEAETTKAAYAAAAAGEQDREWQYVDLFFRNQDEAPAHTVSDEFLDDIGNAIPDFDLDAWREARDSPEVADRVEADVKLAADLGLPAFGPAVVVSGPNGTKLLEDSPSKEDDRGRGGIGGRFLVGLSCATL